jgi:hypothetical protein
MSRSLVFTACSLVTVGTCLADPPASGYVFPAGGQRGTSVQCRVGGMNLSAECGFGVLGTGVEAPAKISSMPTLVLIGPYHHNPIAQRAWDYPKDMAATLKIAADAPAGVRWWYCTTAEGATQLRPFIVGNLPEVIEDEEATKPNRPQSVKLPVTVNGRIYPRADLDEFSFPGKAGEHISCELVSQQLGHKLDARIELFDSAGGEIAVGRDFRGHDPLLIATLPADGSYVLRVHDIAFEGDQDYIYRLTIRTGPLVTRVFPAGGRRGTEVAVRMYGSGLGPDGFTDQRVALNTEALRPGQIASLGGQRAVSGSAMPALMVASTSTATPASTSAPAGSSGAPGGNAASPQTVLAGLLVHCPFLVGESPEFTETEPNDESAQALRFSVPAVLNGQLGRPGDVDEFVFAARKGERLEFDCLGRRLGSPITGVWSVLDAAGKSVARAEGDTQLAFSAPADGEFRLRVHELHRETHGGPEFIYRVVVAHSQADFRLTLEKDNVGVLPGQSAKIKLSVVRGGGFAGEIQLAASDFPAGVTVSPSVVAANQNQIDLTISAAKDAPIGVTSRALVIGAAVIDGQRVLHTAAPPLGAPADGSAGVDTLAITIVHPPLFSLDTEEIFVAANRGATFPQKFTIRREPGFTGEITLGIADRQTRYLQGATGPEIVVKPDQAEVTYPAFFPDVMDLNRTARVLLNGTAKVTDAAGKTHYVTSTTKKQIVVRVSPSILTLSTDRPLVELARGQAIQVPLRIGRTSEVAGDVAVEAVIPAGMKGVAVTSARVAADQDTATLLVQLAADADIGSHDHILFRATGQRDNHPVIAEARLTVSMASR